MLRELAGERELGYYVAALPLSQAWAFIPLTIVTSISPMLARMRKEDRTRYNTTLQSMFVLMVWLAMAIAIQLPSPLHGWCPCSMGRRLSLQQRYSLPRVLNLAIFESAVVWILNEGRPAIALYKAVLGALASIGLNFLLIPNYGAFGAAASSVISYSYLPYSPTLFCARYLSHADPSVCP
jgi:PST family polysaccharide transporter